MKNISLLPAEIKQYNKSARKRNFLIIVCMLVVIAFTAAYLGLSLAAARPLDDLAKIRNERAELHQKISALKQYEDIVNDAKSREMLIGEAMGNNPDWNALLTEVFHSIPENVSVKDFTITYGNNTGNLDITGKASNSGNVSEWLSKLQEVRGLSDVVCVSSVKGGVDSGTSIAFEFNATILQGSNYDLKQIGGGEGE